LVSLDNVKSPGSVATSTSSVVSTIIAYALILSGAVLISAQLRLKLDVGHGLGSEYNAHPPLLWLIVLLGTFCATFIHKSFVKASPLLCIAVGIGVTVVGALLLTPDVSQLQLLYFIFAALFIALITLVITPKKTPLAVNLAGLGQHRSLLWLWIRFNVLSRYSQTILGILWIVALPVATAFILTFVFSYVLTPRQVGDVPFIAFFLTGLMFWSLFMQGILNGTGSIISKLGLIGQIYFPREVLVIVKLGEALVDLSFVFIATLIINAVAGVLPNLNYIYLPFVLLLQLAFMLGIMFFLSYLTVLVRDLQQLTTVFIQMLFYLTPIMYPLDILPNRLGEILQLVNPVAALINAYRDIIIYNRTPDWVSLYFPFVLSGVLLYSGYMFFKANERKLADFR
jgi:lipopolysaccharide transport system permease protein